MPQLLRAVLRIGVGLVGALWCLGGLWGVVVAGWERAWGAVVSAALAALVGYALAYAAFVRMPWEAPRTLDDRAA